MPIMKTPATLLRFRSLCQPATFGAGIEYHFFPMFAKNPIPRFPRQRLNAITHQRQNHRIACLKTSKVFD